MDHMKNIIFKMTAVAVTACLIVQNVAWADPAFETGSTIGRSMQIPSKFCSFSRDQFNLSILDFTFCYVLKQFPDVENINYRLRPQVDGVKIVLDFSKKERSDTFLSVPCAVGDGRVFQYYYAIIQLRDHDTATLIKIKPFGDTINEEKHSSKNDGRDHLAAEAIFEVKNIQSSSRMTAYNEVKKRVTRYSIGPVFRTLISVGKNYCRATLRRLRVSRFVVTLFIVAVILILSPPALAKNAGFLASNVVVSAQQADDMSFKAPGFEGFQEKLSLHSKTAVEYGNLWDQVKRGAGEKGHLSYVGKGRNRARAPITDLQRLLTSLNYDIGPDGVDGIWGKNTENALMRYQASRKLDPDAIVGPLTAAALVCDKTDEETIDPDAHFSGDISDQVVTRPVNREAGIPVSVSTHSDSHAVACEVSCVVPVTPKIQEIETTMPFNGTIRPLINKGADFGAGETIAQLLEDRLQAQGEIMQLRAHHEELAQKKSAIAPAYALGAVSEKDWRELTLEDDIVKITMETIESSWQRALSLPFAGTIKEVTGVALSAGDAALRVQRWDASNLHLSIPQRHTQLVRKGYPFIVLVDGKECGHRLVSVENGEVIVEIENADGLSNDTHSCELAFAKPGHVHDLPDGILLAQTCDVRYKCIRAINAPFAGEMTSPLLFTKGERLKEGQCIPIVYDTASLDGKARIIRAKISYQRWYVEALRSLHEKGYVSDVEMMAEGLRLDNLCRELSLAEAEIERYKSPNVTIPWDAVVINNACIYAGKHIEKDESLLVTAREDLFTARFLLDSCYMDVVHMSDIMDVFVEGSGAKIPATVYSVQSRLTDLGEKKTEVILEIHDSEHKLFPGCEVEAAVASKKVIGIAKTEDVGVTAPAINKASGANLLFCKDDQTMATPVVCHDGVKSAHIGWYAAFSLAFLGLSGVFLPLLKMKQIRTKLAAGTMKRGGMAKSDDKVTAEKCDTVNDVCMSYKVRFFKSYNSFSTKTLKKRIDLLIKLGFLNTDIQPVYVRYAGYLIELRDSRDAEGKASWIKRWQELEGKIERLNKKKYNGKLSGKEAKKLGYYSLIFDTKHTYANESVDKSITNKQYPRRWAPWDRVIRSVIISLLLLVWSPALAGADAPVALPAVSHIENFVSAVVPGHNAEYHIYDGFMNDVDRDELILNRLRNGVDTDNLLKSIDEISAAGRNDLLQRIFWDEGMSPEVREWSVLQISFNRDTKRLFNTFGFAFNHGYQSSIAIEERKIFGFIIRVLDEHIKHNRIALYTMPELQDDASRKNVDTYLKFMFDNFPAAYCGSVAEQIQSVTDFDALKLRWQISGIAEDAALYNFAQMIRLRHHGRLFLEPFVENRYIVGNNAFKKMLSFLGVYNEKMLRNERDLNVFLSSEILRIWDRLSVAAPDFVDEFKAYAPIRINGENEHISIEHVSNLVSHYAGSVSELRTIANNIHMVESKGSSVMTKEFCDLAGSIDMLLISDSHLAKNADGLIDAYFGFNDAAKIELIKYMDEMGYFALQPQTLAFLDGDAGGEASSSLLRLRMFYADVLLRDICPELRECAIDSLLRTYRSGLAVSEFAFSGDNALSRYGIRVSEFELARGAAEFYLKRAVLAALVNERTEYFRRRATGELTYHMRSVRGKLYAESIEMGKKIENLNYLRDGFPRIDAIVDDLVRFAISKSDVDERVEYYRAYFKSSARDFWQKPRLITPRFIGFLAAIVCGLYYFIVKPLSFLKPMNNSTVSVKSAGEMRGTGRPGFFLLTKPILKCWAKSGGASWGGLYNDYLRTLVEFYVVLAVKLAVNLTFATLVIFIEGYGGFEKMFALWIGLIFIEQATNIAQEIRREKLGRIFYDIFPLLMDNEINHFKHIRGATRENLRYLFDNSFRLSKTYALGKLSVMYSAEHFLSVLSVVCGFMFINHWLALAYCVFVVFIMNQFFLSAARQRSLGALGDEKERRLSEGVKRNAIMAKLGFDDGDRDIVGDSIWDGTNALMREKIKYTAHLRFFAVLFPGVGALCSMPLSAVVLSEGMRTFFFLPDLAKSMAEARFAERELYNFTDTAVRFITRYMPKMVLDDKHRISVFDSLEISDLTLRVGPAPDDVRHDPRPIVLKSVNVTIPFGTVNFLGGKSGSGKTTMLHAVSQIDPSQIAEGRIILRGRNASGEDVSIDTKEAKPCFHYLSFEGLDGNYSIEQLLSFLHTDEAKEKFLNYVKRYIGVDTDAVQLHDLSSGQMSRVKLAFILSASNAPVLLLDQPFSWVDKASREAWIKLIKAEAVSEGRMVIIAEPLEQEDSELCGYDNVYFIEESALSVRQCGSDNSANENTIRTPNNAADTTTENIIKSIAGNDGLAKAFIDALLSRLVNKKVIFVFDNTVNAKALNLCCGLRRLKLSPRFKTILKNLEIVDDAPAALPGVVDQYRGKSNVEVFVFESLKNESNRLTCGQNVNISFIDDIIFPAEFYYPLLDIITLTLLEHLEPGTILDSCSYAGIDKGALNVDLDSTYKDPQGALVFKLLPHVKEYGSNKITGKCAQLDAALTFA